MIKKIAKNMLGPDGARYVKRFFGPKGNSKGNHAPALFLHIQKTAGSTMVHLAETYYGSKNIISHGDYAGRSPESLSKIPFVSGHFGYDYAKSIIKTRPSFTFLREPAERIVSLYYFFRAHDPDTFPMYRIAHENTLLEFLRLGFTNPLVKSRIWNNQTWMLAHGYGNLNGKIIDKFTEQELVELAIEHLSDFAFVGLSEKFNQDSARIINMLGWPEMDTNIKINENKKKSKKDELSSEERQLLADLSELDNVIYEHVANVVRPRILKDLEPIS